MLEDLKLLLGITDDSQDALLGFMLDYAANLVANYCGIRVIPVELDNVVAMIAAGAYSFGAGMGADGGEVKSLTEGDTTVSMTTALDRLNAMDKSSLLMNYQQQLNAFRRMRW